MTPPPDGGGSPSDRGGPSSDRGDPPSDRGTPPSEPEDGTRGSETPAPGSAAGRSGLESRPSEGIPLSTGAAASSNAADAPSDRWLEVRQRIDDVEAGLRRGRLTVPTYLAATAFFLTTGFVTGNWPPAAVLGALCLLAAWVTHHIRRRRMVQLRALEELEASLPRGPTEGGGGMAERGGSSDRRA